MACLLASEYRCDLKSPPIHSTPLRMLLDQERLPSFYNDVVSLSLKERSPVLILVARDVDALCACRALTVG